MYLPVHGLDRAPGRLLRRGYTVDHERDLRDRPPATKLLARRGERTRTVVERRIVSGLDDTRRKRGRLTRSSTIRDCESQGTAAAELARAIPVDDGSDGVRDTGHVLISRDRRGSPKGTGAITPRPTAGEEGEGATRVDRVVHNRALAVDTVVDDTDVTRCRRTGDLPLRPETRTVPALHMQNMRKAGVDRRSPEGHTTGEERTASGQVGRLVKPIDRRGERRSSGDQQNSEYGE